MISPYLTELSATGNTMDHYKIRFETNSNTSMVYCTYEHYFGEWENRNSTKHTETHLQSYSYNTIPQLVENGKIYDMTVYCYTTNNYKVTVSIYFDCKDPLMLYVKVEVETLTKLTKYPTNELAKSIEYDDLLDCIATARTKTVSKNCDINEEYMKTLYEECAIEYAKTRC